MTLLRLGSFRIAVITPILIAALLIPATAATGVTTTLKASFSGDLGEGTIATDEFTFSGTEYGGHPEPLTNVTVHLPAGVEGSRTGFATCEVSTIEMAGINGCPPGSLAGPSTSIGMFVSFGTETVAEEGTVQAVFGAGEAVSFFVDATTPVSVEVLMTGTYMADSAPYSHVLNLAVPQIESVPGALHASITALTLAFGAIRNEDGSEIHSVTVPRACPSGGLGWLANTTFGNGTTTEVSYKGPCPPASITSPILGQRQTVHVTAGEVTVRRKGTTSFVPLSGASTIPDGSEVDSTNGRALITAATAMPGHTKSAEISGGRLLIHQEDAGVGETHLILSRPLTGCPDARRPHSSAAALATSAKHRSGARSRKLWVSDNGGSWGTNGRYVSTTVEGTHWLTVDECNRSRVTVAAGKVKVHDLINDKTKILTAGESYVAARHIAPTTDDAE
jgi:hypothetical protein